MIVYTQEIVAYSMQSSTGIVIQSIRIGKQSDSKECQAHFRSKLQFIYEDYLVLNDAVV